MRRSTLLFGGRLCALAGALGLMVSCTKGAPFKASWSTSRVALDVRADELERVGLVESAARAWFEKRLREEGFVQGVDVREASASWSVEVVVSLQADEESTDATGFQFDLEMSEKNSGTHFKDSRIEVWKTTPQTPVEEPRALVQPAYESGIAQASRFARALAQGLARPSEVLVRALGSNDSAEREAALQILTVRKHSAVFHVWAERLKESNPLTVRRAIGALVELGDVRAAPLVIEASRARDEVFQREVVFAIGAIGGDEAEAYLYTVAQGHESALLRKSADLALSELRTRHSRRDGGSDRP